MRVHLLGAHQGESREYRFISFVVDDRLAIDAGGLTSSLSLDEQYALEAVLITHRHFDHIKDLPMLAHNLWEIRSMQVYCIADTLSALRTHVFDGLVWPNVEEAGEGFYPVTFHTVEPEKWFKVLDYNVYAIPMPHTVPAVGYCIEGDGKRVFYTADTRGNGDPHWAHLRPDLLLIETTMSSEFDEHASQFGHMTPVALGRELKGFYAKEGYYPRIVCVHLNPRHEQRIREELTILARELGADISAGREGMVIEL